MSQWGKRITINGARFVPHIDTMGFVAVEPGSKILDINLLDDGGDRALAIMTLTELQARFTGASYDTWLLLPDSQRKRRKPHTPSFEVLQKWALENGHGDDLDDEAYTAYFKAHDCGPNK